MRIPKKYGQSKIDPCPFCDNQGIIKNPQGIPVCSAHRSNLLKNIKCSCGQLVEIREGKWGAFALCFNCGPVNLKKLLEINVV